MATTGKELFNSRRGLPHREMSPITRNGDFYLFLIAQNLWLQTNLPDLILKHRKDFQVTHQAYQ